MAYVHTSRFYHYEFGGRKLGLAKWDTGFTGTSGRRSSSAVILSSAKLGEDLEGKKKLRILIAGGGIGGLVLALAAKNKGFDVKVFEKDLSAVRGEGIHRGPIQLQSSALAILEAIDACVARQIMDAGCVTGDRINGLVDGITGAWFAKFDLLTPAVERGLPVTQVICRMTLQDILVNAVGYDIIYNSCTVVDFKEDASKVVVILDDGRQYEGDILVGADGIWSKVRAKLFGSQEANYSGYTCYSGSAEYVPPNISTVGYQVFLGFNQYFVASDVGDEKMQWYAFHKEPPGSVDPPEGKKRRLLELFGNWCHEVVNLISVTTESKILRRDIYDRDMIHTWSKGCVTLLGDSVHAMQPNLGQGGCMAIEDCYELVLELEKASKGCYRGRNSEEIASALTRYEKKRLFRVSIIHAITRRASEMVSTYQPFLDFRFHPLSFLTEMRIPHPGMVAARIFIQFGMPVLMTWMLTGHSLDERLDPSSKPGRERFLEDDHQCYSPNVNLSLLPSGFTHPVGMPKEIQLPGEDDWSFIIGSVACKPFEGIPIVIANSEVSCQHAHITCKSGAFFLSDLQSDQGTWMIDPQNRKFQVHPNRHIRVRPGYKIQLGPSGQVVLKLIATRSPQRRQPSR